MWLTTRESLLLIDFDLSKLLLVLRLVRHFFMLVLVVFGWRFGEILRQVPWCKCLPETLTLCQEGEFRQQDGWFLVEKVKYRKSMMQLQ